MDSLAAYLPTDRRHALARGADLPAHTNGAALFADISGFTPLTEALLHALGPQRGAEELSRHLNTVYDALIAEVDRYGGSVLVFSGDAITCWFEEQTPIPGPSPHKGEGSGASPIPDSSDSPFSIREGGRGVRSPATRRAVTCGLAMQTAMQQFATLTLATGGTVSLAMKVAVATGPARRFIIGDPAIQKIDVLAGATLDRMAAIEKHAKRGEVMVDSATLTQLGEGTRVARRDDAGPAHFAALDGLKRRAHPRPRDPNPREEQVHDESNAQTDGSAGSGTGAHAVDDLSAPGEFPNPQR